MTQTPATAIVTAALLGACVGSRPASPPTASPPTAPPPARGPAAGLAPTPAGAKDAPAIPGLPGPRWPLITAGVESRYFSSFDRTGRNADGFTGKHSALYVRPDGQQVIFDALGPGVLRTLWFTGPREGGEGLDLGRIRFYFDDEPTPRIETDQQRLFDGKQPPFEPPLVANNRVSTGGFVSWVPLPYRSRLIITTEKRPSFYIAQYDRYPAGWAMASYAPGMDVSVLARRFRAALGGPDRGPVQSVPLQHRHAGEGTIELIRFKPKSPPTAASLNRSRIKVWWDGQTNPAIDVPLGMFFGSGLGLAPVRSMAFAMDPEAFENRLPMPFWRGFRVKIEGIDGALALRIAPSRFAREDAGHLHAIYRKAAPTTPGVDFTWVDQRGAGKLVGTVLTIVPPTPETKRWWEGDLRSYADGRRTPGLHGTGHEDDHLGGWSNTFLTGPFSLPMHGEPATEVIDRKGVQYNARTTLYRLWPGIHFWGSVLHGVEHGNENGVQLSYAGVTFLYALPGGPRLAEVAHLDLGSPDSRRAHGWTVEGDVQRRKLASAFEGRAYQSVIRDTSLYHRGVARFTLAGLKGRPNRGCYLRRLYDQQEGRQRARVVVDGQTVGDWYTAEGNATLRWAERDLFLPSSITAGRTELAIEIHPATQSPLWSAVEYRLLCIARR